jgi:hypothetical protein
MTRLAKLFAVWSLITTAWLQVDAREAESAAASSAHYAEVKAALLALLEADQAGRRRMAEVERTHGRESPEMRKLWEEIDATDSANLAHVEAILARYGWLGPEQVGAKASAALFFVIQHADLPSQRKYLPMIREAAKTGRAQPSALALLEDRVALREGRLQTYGSQIGFSEETNSHYVLPMADPDKVDERRAAVGLPPLADYVKQWKIVWDVEAYKRQLPTLRNTFAP